MSSLFDSLSEELFQILKGSGKTLTLYGSDGNKTYDPKKARRVFAVPGNLMISVTEAGSDSEVKLYLSQSTDVQEIAPLIQTLRQITTRYNVLFNVRKFGRELQPKDFAYQVSVTEAAMWGSTKTSYQRIGETKLIVRHTAPVREGVIGARGRNILGMFVETKHGERFKFPANHLSGGRAFAQHINQGGKPHDTVGTQIAELAFEALQLANTARYIHHSRNALGESALEIRSTIKNRVVEIRKAFMGLARPRGYNRVVEAGLPLSTTDLLEGVDEEVTRLAGVLQIDTDHSLAEALKPVALLTLGENMTNMNNEFQGMISLDETIADALVEALSDEYGHDAGWTRDSANIHFTVEAAYNDARSYLDLVEAEYSLDEAGPYSPENGWDMDHKYWKDNPEGHHDQSMAQLVDGFDYDAFWHDYMPDRTDPFAFEEPLDAKEIKSNIAGILVKELDADGYGNATAASVRHEVDEIFEWIKKEAEDEGFKFAVSEFAQFEEKPEHHGIAAGDYVATDFGSGKVISVEGDIAAVEFLNGSTKTVHVDDMDKVDMLGNIAEEADLAEWFNGFDPSSVLEHGFEHGIPGMARKTVDGFDSEVLDGDRVTHGSYGSGTVVADDGKFIKVAFDNPHARLPANKTVTLSRGKVTKAGGARKPFDQPVDEAAATPPPPIALMNAARKAREISKEGVVQHVDDLGNGNYRVSDWMDDNTIVSYSNGNCTSGNDPLAAYESIDEARNSGVRNFDSTIETELEDDIEVSVEYEWDEDYPIMYSVTIKKTGEVIEFEDLDQKTRDRLEQEAHEDIIDDEAARADYEYDRYRERMWMGEARFTGFRTFDSYIDTEVEDDVEITCEFEIDDNRPLMYDVMIKATGETIAFQDLDTKTQLRLEDEAMEELNNEAAAYADYQYDQYRDRKMMGEDDVEVIGGDKGLDLIDDVKVQEAPEDVFAGYSDEMLKKKLELAQNAPGHESYVEALRAELGRRGISEDTMFREELEKLIKNAMFRR